MAVIKLKKILSEVAYDGNLGFHEMFVFYSKANDWQVQKLEDLILKKKFKDAWRFVQKVTGMALKGAAFESTMLEAIANTHFMDIDEVLKVYQSELKKESKNSSINRNVKLKILSQIAHNPKNY
jgi:hypothetical protein